MRALLLIGVFFYSLFVNSQNEQKALQYFNNGEFEKALITYNKLYEVNNGNTNYLLKIIEVHQQLEHFDIAEKLLLQLIDRTKNPQYLVELGYNFQLKNEHDKANDYYNLAVLKIDENPVFAFSIARRFEKHALIDYAATVYERAMKLKPESNYYIQLARIYGEQGKTEKMFSSYVNFMDRNPAFISQSKRIFSDYISENAEDENNILLRKVLLKKMQGQPNIIWNQLLSWLFIQQRDYTKAFAQEKAIFKREQETILGITDLAAITIKDGNRAVSEEILRFIINNAFDLDTVLKAHKDLLELETKYALKKDYYKIDQQYKSLLKDFGMLPQTIDFQISYAHFTAFYSNKPETAIVFLKETLKIKAPQFLLAKAKLKLGDILVFQEKFNEALIYFSQIQTSLKNSTISQEARFRVAKTSYYKGDFKWAESQLKILKSSTSQLIANDALDLKLLISDNKYEDSLQTALKLYAKADLMAFQNRTDKAISLLDKILQEHKTETIIDQALYKQAQLFESKQQFEKAEDNYLKIIANYKEDILADDAYYALAELYLNHLAQPEKAKVLYEQIIFNHEDSIYFVEARKKFRVLRGDAIN
ncbi:MAG: tetratricopeptide repeat protein [Bacteroidetes bacterium]|nr:tetratricopeptide repeat protein [Bacteroidota bacterium]